MSGLTKITGKLMQDLAGDLPVKMDVISMQEASDILLLKGMHALETIIDESDNQELRIKAVNTIINCGRYLEKRKENNDSKPQKLIINSKYSLDNGM